MVARSNAKSIEDMSLASVPQPPLCEFFFFAAITRHQKHYILLVNNVLHYLSLPQVTDVLEVVGPEVVALCCRLLLKG